MHSECAAKAYRLGEPDSVRINPSCRLLHLKQASSGAVNLLHLEQDTAVCILGVVGLLPGISTAMRTTCCGEPLAERPQHLVGRVMRPSVTLRGLVRGRRPCVNTCTKCVNRWSRYVDCNV